VYRPPIEPFVAPLTNRYMFPPTLGPQFKVIEEPPGVVEEVINVSSESKGFPLGSEIRDIEVSKVLNVPPGVLIGKSATL